MGQMYEFFTFHTQINVCVYVYMNVFVFPRVCLFIERKGGVNSYPPICVKQAGHCTQCIALQSTEQFKFLHCIFFVAKRDIGNFE